MFIKLTAEQLEALEHRLSVPDCICEVLGEEEPHYHGDDVGAVIDALTRGIGYDGISTKEADELHKRIVDAVLVDCVHGSTWVAVHEGEYGRTHPKAIGAFRTMDNLARAIEEARGIPHVPRPGEAID